MKTRTFVFAVAAALAGMLAFSGSGFAAKGGQPGPPDGGGGGAPPDFGDLIILLRDADGVPIPSPVVKVTDPETNLLVDGGLCWQPIAFNVTEVDKCPTSCQVTDTDPVTVLVDQYSCAVALGCTGCTQEVDFGRINEARSPETVFDSQLEDVIVNLATADQITLDPAGRLVASTCDSTLDNLAKTIDSPLQNLAIYRELMLTGFIGADPGLELPADVYDTAARGLGAASDKSGGVNVDLVHYLNQIMGLDAAPTIIGKLCETYREEVKGVMQLVEKCYLNYGLDLSDIGPAGANYGYTRSLNFSGDYSVIDDGLPNPAYIPADLPEEGWFEYLAVVDPDETNPAFQIDQGLIQDAVFCVDVDGNPLDPVWGEECDELIPGTSTVAQYDGLNIEAFAQASDDARAVIDFMHTNQVPVGYETPVPCTPSGEVSYDLLISPVSGLKVPTQMTSPTDGREFTVAVTNGGPDTGAGTVTVTADPADGGLVVAALDDDGIYDDYSPFVFSFTNLAPGASSSRTVMFVIGAPNVRTSIVWSATVEADPEGADPNPSNNTVTATTNVKTTGGGGGGGGGGG